MSWISWLFLLAILYIVVLILRAVVQFATWLYEEKLGGYRGSRQLREKSSPPQPAQDANPEHASNTHQASNDTAHRTRHRIGAVSSSGIRKPSAAAKLLKRLKLLVAWKSYDYWVASALSESDPQIKIRYLTKALKLDPTYSPAWGLKGTALLGLKRYEEALQCFARSLEIHANASIWHKKGLCCYHLGRHEQAVECFNEAIRCCPKEDRELHREAIAMKELAEDTAQGRQRA